MYVYQDRVSPPEKKLKNCQYNWSGKDVIELGCNVGKLGVYVLALGAKSYKGYDIDKNMIGIGTSRYTLDLSQDDVIKSQEEYGGDVVIAMALFHHFKEKDLVQVLKRIKSKELVFEVPVGKNDVGLYQTRTEEEYRKLVEENYGKVIDVVESGATNDAYNKRFIFYCKLNEEI